MAAINGPGSVTVGIKRCNVGDYPAGLADITGGANFSLTAEDEHLDAVLAGWDLDVNIGDRYQFELLAVDGVVKSIDIFFTLS